MLDDPIMFWNAVVIECNRLDHSNPVKDQAGPTLSSRATAIAHIAMHDAYVLTQRALGVTPQDPYLPPAQQPPLTLGALTPAQAQRLAAIAVGSAACTALLHLYPHLDKTLDAEFDRFCVMWGGDGVGHDFGRAVGNAVVNLRRNDGANPDPDTARPNYVASRAAGHHREDPGDPSQGFHGPGYGRVRPFAITAFHPLAPPPDLGTPKYVADLTEVAAKGAAAGHTRTADETVQGLYWAYDGPKGLGTPPRLYNQVIRKIVEPLGLTTAQLARLFFLANVAMGDAGILSWYWKYEFDVWRPVVGIREHDQSMGPGALDSGGGPGTPSGSNPVVAPCDPFWRPLGAPRTNEPEKPSFTPPFPAYPSGHATFGAAAFEVTRRYLKSIGKATIGANKLDNLAFHFVSEELDGKSVDGDGTVRTRHVRKFNGLHEAIYENSVSRVFLGVHWRFDGTTGTSPATMLSASNNIGGVPLGLAIATDLLGQANVKPSTVVAPT